MLRKGFTAATRSSVRKKLGLVLKKARANKENKARANKENKARANKENKAKCRGQEQESYEKHFIVLVYFLSRKTVFSSVSVQDSHSDKEKILICSIYFGYFIFAV